VVPIPSARPTATRGLATSAIKAFIIKVAGKVGDKLASLALAKLAAHVEASTWQRGLQEGWLQVTKDTLAAKQLEAGRPSSTDRSLLLIHGTFSSAAAAYHGSPLRTSSSASAPLRQSRLRLRPLLAEPHARRERADAARGLPDKTFTFDVITHSRGGLVLRNLVERSAAFGPLAKRFKLGRAVLVASPNEGTPLATPARWENTVGWMANLLELFPVENPFTTGAAFVANGLVWIARHASGDLPGLHSMDGDGDLIAELQKPPGPPPDAYSALVSNYNPDEKVLMRMVDAGVDQFFGSANDLVVPSEGGWRIDRAASPFIPGTRIGCFGPGETFRRRGDSRRFLLRASHGRFHRDGTGRRSKPLSPVDPAKNLPDRRLLRSRAAGVSAPITSARRERAARPAETGPALRVTVVNGDLTFERLPLLIGHYQASKLTGAERIMNRVIGGAMGQALDLGDYPMDPGADQIFVNRLVAGGQVIPRPKAVIVVGLGQEGSLRAAELIRTVRQGVIAWARQVVDGPEPEGQARSSWLRR
jgi:hypothetical protein